MSCLFMAVNTPPSVGRTAPMAELGWRGIIDGPGDGGGHPQCQDFRKPQCQSFRNPHTFFPVFIKPVLPLSGGGRRKQLPFTSTGGGNTFCRAYTGPTTG